MGGTGRPPGWKIYPQEWCRTAAAGSCSRLFRGAIRLWRAITHDGHAASTPHMSQPMSNAALMQLLGRWMGSHECDPDASFVSRFLSKRDEDAFAALVHRHGPLVYGTCLRILGNRTDTDDAFQAVFFVLARRAHTLKLD